MIGNNNIILIKQRIMRYINKIQSIGLLILLIAFTGCNKDNDVLDLQSDPGSDFINVENDGYVVNLNAQAPSEGQTGTWRIYMGENGHFEDINDPGSEFYGEPGETYLIGWEVSAGEQYKAETITVSFKPLKAELLTAVSDTTFNNVSIELEAEAARFGAEGHWSIVAGEGGRIEDADNHISQFIGKEGRDYELKWVLSYGSKEDVQMLAFHTDTLRAFAGPDELDIKTEKYKDNKFCNLKAFLPAGATGSWELVNGYAGSLYTTASPNSIFEGVADSVYTLTWTVDLDEYQSVDTVQVRFRGKWGMWTDDRDGQTYRFTEVNGLEWMAENYNYKFTSQYGRSWYYGQSARALISSGYPVESEEDRKRFGRLYNYIAAVDGAPEGWRLPTREEFEELENHFGGRFYSTEVITEGGHSGIDLNYAGTVSYSNESTSSRDYYSSLGEVGGFWLDAFNPARNESMFIMTDTNGFLGLAPGHIYFSGLSVRYVRDIQED